MASDLTMSVGEALVGDGNEIAHIDLLIGTKTGPVGMAFAAALANQSAGHSNLLAVLEPNLLCKPATILVTKVTIQGMKQAVQMFGPAQASVAKAVADCLAEGTIPAAEADNLCIVCGVFIHPQAADDKKIYEYNHAATKLAIERAMKNDPTPSEVIAKKDTAKHPFAGRKPAARVTRDSAPGSGPPSRRPAEADDPAPARHRPGAQRLRRRGRRRTRASEHLLRHGGVRPEAVPRPRPGAPLHPGAGRPQAVGRLRSAGPTSRRARRSSRPSGRVLRPVPGFRAARLERGQHDRRLGGPGGAGRGLRDGRRGSRRSSWAPGRSAGGSPGSWLGSGSRSRSGPPTPKAGPPPSRSATATGDRPRPSPPPTRPRRSASPPRS